jgi:hypothetical protein
LASFANKPIFFISFNKLTPGISVFDPTAVDLGRKARKSGLKIYVDPVSHKYKVIHQIAGVPDNIKNHPILSLALANF